MTDMYDIRTDLRVSVRYAYTICKIGVHHWYGGSTAILIFWLPFFPLIQRQSAFFNVQLSAKFSNWHERKSIQAATVVPALASFHDPALVQEFFAGLIPGVLAFPPAHLHFGRRTAIPNSRSTNISSETSVARGSTRRSSLPSTVWLS